MWAEPKEIPVAPAIAEDRLLIDFSQVYLHVPSILPRSAGGGALEFVTDWHHRTEKLIFADVSLGDSADCEASLGGQLS